MWQSPQIQRRQATCSMLPPVRLDSPAHQLRHHECHGGSWQYSLPAVPADLYNTPSLTWTHAAVPYFTTFCACDEFSYDRDCVLRHQRTLKCNVGYLFEVDAATFPKFFEVIRPLVKDPGKLAQLSKGFPAPRAITAGPLPNVANRSSSSQPPHSSFSSQRFQSPQIMLCCLDSADPPHLLVPQWRPPRRRRDTPLLHPLLHQFLPRPTLCVIWSNVYIQVGKQVRPNKPSSLGYHQRAD